MRAPTRPNRSRYAAIDPLSAVGPVLDRGSRVETCCCFCCRCSRTRTLQWALAVFVAESVWHLTIAALRPLLIWHGIPIYDSSDEGLFTFAMANFCRCILLLLVGNVWLVWWRGQSGLAELRAFLRWIILLFGLEVLAIFNKLILSRAEHVCYESEYRRHRPGATGRASAITRQHYHDYNNGTGLTQRQCELLSDAYDYVQSHGSIL